MQIIRCRTPSADTLENLADLVPALRAELDKVPASRKEEIIEAAEILIKYSGYIKREQIIADKINRLENIRIKGKFDYNSIQSLSTEARQKLTRIDPDTIAQASRIPGISLATSTSFGTTRKIKHEMFHVKHIKGDIQMNEAKTLVIRGNLVDIINRRTFGAEISILNGHIGKVTPTGQDEGYYLLPGFIDAHVHIESSMVTPTAFIHAAVRHGSIGAVADPHEIANVMGTEGVEYMLDNAKGIPFYTWFGVPSCVPATIMETSGAIIDADKTARLLEREDLHFLAEMMNYPGVLNKDPEVMRKIEAAKQAGKPIDGHYPLATGPKLKAYIESGISTDHETIYLEKRP